MCSYTTWRGWSCCTCLAAWLPVLEGLSQDQGDISGALAILQLRGSNPASSGTHAEGGVFDLGYYSGNQARALVGTCRQMGADATWYRDWDGNHHVHGVLTGCPRNGPAAYQIEAVKDGYDGLGYMGQEGPDDGPKPLSGRTWEQGIEWAEDQMALSDDDVTRIANAVWNTKLQYEGTADATAEAHLTNANMRARNLQSEGPASTAEAVWAAQVSRGEDGPYQAASWLTLAAEAADEVRDDANAVTGAMSSSTLHYVVLALAVLGLLTVAVLALVLR